MIKKKVTFLVDEDLLCDYKKVLIDKRTNLTANFSRHMKDVVDNHYPREALKEDIKWMMDPNGPDEEED